MDEFDCPKVNNITSTTNFAGKWLVFEEMKFKDPVMNEQRNWEYVRRSGHISNRVDEIVGILKKRGESDKIVLVVQYRPPTRSYCVEFPADAEEDPQEAARRELLEETGYVFKRVIMKSPELFYEPGLSNSSMQLIYVEIDGDAPENNPPIPKRETDEWGLRTILLPVDNLYDHLKKLHETKGVAIDAKLFTFAYGMTQEKFQ